MVMKIYSDKKFLPAGSTCHILIPFWGQNKEIGPDVDRFDEYISRVNEIFQFSSLDDADIVIYPASPKYNKKQFQEFQNITGTKTLIVFFNDDSDEILDYRNNTYIFRTSFYKSTQKLSEFALPGWHSDYGKNIEIRKWKPKPTISFCGQIYPLDVRKLALDILESNSNVNTNFIRRDKFWGGWIANKKEDYGKRVRAEFKNNLNNGDYVLCGRGGGNFSYRLYEAMMCKRIPILINTDCVLPYDFLIDWKNYFPIIDKKDINYFELIMNKTIFVIHHHILII